MTIKIPFDLYISHLPLNHIYIYIYKRPKWKKWDWLNYSSYEDISHKIETIDMWPKPIRIGPHDAWPLFNLKQIVKINWLKNKKGLILNTWGHPLSIIVLFGFLVTYLLELCAKRNELIRYTIIKCWIIKDDNKANTA